MKRKRSGPHSIWTRLIVGIVGVTLLAASATSFLIYKRFIVTNSAFRDRTLQNDARLITKLIARAGEGQQLKLPDFLDEDFRKEGGKYAIVSDNGVLLAGSLGVKGPLAPIEDDSDRDFFLTSGDAPGHQLYGYTIRGSYGTRPVWIQLALPHSEVVVDSILEEFIKDVGWIWVPFLFGLVVTNLMVARIGLKPLRVAAAQAEGIGPNDVSVRLPETGLPHEVLVLVSAVNRGLERLEVAFDAQKKFIADAAHELRTPVAVLKTHVAVLPQTSEIASLMVEVDAMGRLVNQLLDSARLESLTDDKKEHVDLGEIAQSVAEQLAPVALSTYRSIEIVRASKSAIIPGARFAATCALRNLVENALRYTPRGTSVVIEVLDPPGLRVSDHGPGIDPAMREAIFGRFWQGGRDRGGAGLGLDIVNRAVSRLGGALLVGTAPTGGAMITMDFSGPRQQLQS